MNEINKDNTEQKILDAANEVFTQKGMDGTRMQEIANRAGINKALLHYYFRTKQKLFEAIFKRVFANAFPKISALMLSDLPIKEKISAFIDNYIGLLAKNPHIPAFILKEINRDPEMLANVIKSSGINPREVIEMMKKEMEAGNIRKMDPKEVMINIVALSIFPFVGRPLLETMIFENDQKAYQAFLNKRKQTVKEFVFNAILLK